MSDPLVGRRLGKYSIEQKLGQGGMGAVYRARDNLGRVVALKVLPPHFAAQPEWVERFRREASRAALLDHPNIVAVHEADAVDGHHYIAMQFMEGGSLEGLLQRRGALPPAEAARLVRDVARGLARAHGQGVIHRDIKPANILLGPAGEARLGDFGLVKSVEGGDQPLTQTGVVLGTPHYMAPEQCEGLPDIDGRADLYALGLVLYQALSNVLPVKGTTPLQIIRHRLEEDPPPLSTVAPGTPPALVDLVHALLARDRDRRLGRADDLAARLDAFLAGAPAPAFLAGAPAPAVPTARLVRATRPAEPPVLPDLGGQRPGRAPVGKAPARGGAGWALALLGCGLVAAVVGLCVVTAALGRVVDEADGGPVDVREAVREAQREAERRAHEALQRELQGLPAVISPEDPDDDPDDDAPPGRRRGRRGAPGW